MQQVLGTDSYKAITPGKLLTPHCGRLDCPECSVERIWPDDGSNRHCAEALQGSTYRDHTTTQRVWSK